MTIEQWLGCSLESYEKRDWPHYDRPESDHCYAAEVIERDTDWDPQDMAEVLWHVDGENDEADWAALMRAKDGRYWFVAAWCDYTGWGCQDGGTASVTDSAEHAFSTLFVDQRHRDRDPEAWEAARARHEEGDGTP